MALSFAVGIHQIIIFFLSFLCLPFYFVFIFTIIRFVREPLKYRKYLSFYHLILSCSFADVCFVLNYYLPVRFLQWEWLPYDLGGDWLAISSLALAWYIKYSQAIAVLFIGVNRLYAIQLPIKYIQWQKSLTFKLISIQWLLPFFLMSPILLLCNMGVRQKINGSVTSVIRGDTRCVMPSFFISTLVQFTIAVTLIAMYGSMFWKIRRHNRQVQNTTTSAGHKKNAEKKSHQKLALSGAIISAMMIFAACLNVVPVLTRGNVGPYFSDIFTLSLMLFSLVNPFVLVAMSEPIRNGFKTTLKLILSLKCPTKVVPNFVTTQQTRARRAANVAESRL